MDTKAMGGCYVCSNPAINGINETSNIPHCELVDLLINFARYLDQSTFTFNPGNVTSIFLCKDCLESAIKLNQLGIQKARINKEITDSTAEISQGILNRRNQINPTLQSVISSYSSADPSSLDNSSVPTELDTTVKVEEESTEQNILTSESETTIQKADPLESTVNFNVDETEQNELPSASNDDVKEEPGSLDTPSHFTFTPSHFTFTPLQLIKKEKTGQNELPNASNDDVKEEEPGSLDTVSDFTFTPIIDRVETIQEKVSPIGDNEIKNADPSSLNPTSDRSFSTVIDKVEKSGQDKKTTASNAGKTEIKEVMQNPFLTSKKEDLMATVTDLCCNENYTFPGNGDKSELFEKEVGHEGSIRQFLPNEVPEAGASKVRTECLKVGVHETMYVKETQQEQKPLKHSFVKSSSWKSDDLKIHDIKESSSITDTPFVDSGRKRKSSIHENSFQKKNMSMINVSELINLPISIEDADPLKIAQLNTNPSQQEVTELKPFQCSICKNNFKTHGGLQQHRRVHTEERPYKCSFCEKTFRLKNNLAGHERIHSGEKPYSCSFCEKTCRLKHNLAAHERIHTGEKPYMCLSCGKSFNQQSSLKNHKKVHSEKSPHKCELCETTFTQKRYLTKHQITHSVNKPYMCKVCEKTYVDANSLKTHTKTHSANLWDKCVLFRQKDLHKMRNLKRHDINSAEEPGKIFGGTKQEDTKVTEKIDAAKNATENPNTAQKIDATETVTAHNDNIAANAVVAGSTHTDKNKGIAKNLKQKIGYEKTSRHLENLQASTTKIRKMMLNEETKLPCTDCDKVVGNVWSMKEHAILVHTLDHNCSVCGKSFAQMRTLKMHQATHSETSPYKCLICNKILSSQQSLKTHSRIHTGEKPYQCSSCEKVYRHSGSLKLHARTHK